MTTFEELDGVLDDVDEEEMVELALLPGVEVAAVLDTGAILFSNSAEKKIQQVKTFFLSQSVFCKQVFRSQ